MSTQPTSARPKPKPKVVTTAGGKVKKHHKIAASIGSTQPTADDRKKRKKGPPAEGDGDGATDDDLVEDDATPRDAPPSRGDDDDDESTTAAAPSPSGRGRRSESPRGGGAGLGGLDDGGSLVSVAEMSAPVSPGKPDGHGAILGLPDRADGPTGPIGGAPRAPHRHPLLDESTAGDGYDEETADAMASIKKQAEEFAKETEERLKAGSEKGDGFSPFSRLLISSHVVTQFPLIVLDESSSLVEFSKSGPFP